MLTRITSAPYGTKQWIFNGSYSSKLPSTYNDLRPKYAMHCQGGGEILLKTPSILSMNRSERTRIVALTGRERSGVFRSPVEYMVPTILHIDA